MDHTVSHIYKKIEQAIIFIEQNKTGKLGLKDIAGHIHMSGFHFHRLFTQWAGTTPDRFFKYLKKEYILNKLNKTPFTSLTYQAGVSGPGRMHDLFVTYEALSPGEFRQKGKNITINYGFHDTPFGQCFLALTDKGILELQFIREFEKVYVDTLQERFEYAVLKTDEARTSEIIQRIFAPGNQNRTKPFHLLLQGTNFQIKVWEALLSLPIGNVSSYEKIAGYIGKPSSSRAIGNAIAKNIIAYLIPCHRVIKKIGKTGNYRWGEYRKKIMLGWEFVKKDTRIDRSV